MQNYSIGEQILDDTVMLNFKILNQQMLLHPLQYGSGTDPTFSHRGLVQKLPVGISTKESHSDFWHHL